MGISYFLHTTEVKDEAFLQVPIPRFVRPKLVQVTCGSPSIRQMPMYCWLLGAEILNDAKGKYSLIIVCPGWDFPLYPN